MLLPLEGSRKAGTGGDGLTNEAAVTGQGRCSERHVKAKAKAEGGDRISGVETSDSGEMENGVP